MSARSLAYPRAGIAIPGLVFPRVRTRRPARRDAGNSSSPARAVTASGLVEVRYPGVPRVGRDAFRRSAVVDRRGPRRSHRVHWDGIAVVVTCALLLGSGLGVTARHYLNQFAEAAPLPGLTEVQAEPIPLPGSTPAPVPSPTPLPDRILLQVPYTTQAPLGNWAQHQHTCEEANMVMLAAYWQHDASVVIDPGAADAQIAALVQWQVLHWGSKDDLTDHRLGELAQQYYGFTYEVVPNDQQVIRAQLAAGRPLIAGVRTHALGNANYPGYGNHYEQPTWSVSHYVLVIGYDNDGVWLNDPGITKGRGYHIAWAQLAHAIDSLDQQYPALNEGQVLLLVAPHATQNRPAPRGEHLELAPPGQVP